ncbi:MAG TPA: HAMP domain-containing sensor histidine kinase [Terriglobales bacterium]|nr:HAMP domain-containing sensor histidine kinase [Terriglobales bacterium]
MVLRPHRWTIFTACLLCVYGLAAFVLPRGYALSAFGDLTQLLLIVLAGVVMARNARSSQGQSRLFWLLMAAGCFLWGASVGAWTLVEVMLRRNVPDPFFGDVILFIHIVPFMAAVALFPHRTQDQKNLHFSSLNSLMLLIWWIFLYAFVVFPDEYVRWNSVISSRNYDALYLVENLVLLAALGLLSAKVQNRWKRVYWNLFLAAMLYTLSSLAMNVAITRGQYFTGCWYDIPFVASICWLIYASLVARESNPESDATPVPSTAWPALSLRLAMVAILSLPVLVFWSQFVDTAPAAIRHFRLIVGLAAMLVLGVFVFLRQYLLDRELVRLLGESHRSFENLKRLQTQLVQKEKLASLGQLVAGAAHEINNPVAAILGYSELLALNRDLDSSQIKMAQKIGEQARRTRDLVSGLLSFARQTSSEKTLIDLGQIVQRSLQMKMLQLETKGIKVESRIAAVLPPILGNSNQLLQCCLEIITNAMDAMEETNGGMLWVNVQRVYEEVVVEFDDSGPGMADPQRVFDPFYTTKPIGKGTGLGLSATYGVVQDHQGQITCQNRPEGGAAFILRFPIAESYPAAPNAEKETVGV